MLLSVQSMFSSVSLNVCVVPCMHMTAVVHDDPRIHRGQRYERGTSLHNGNQRKYGYIKELATERKHHAGTTL